jgi:hypothetical protein
MKKTLLLFVGILITLGVLGQQPTVLPAGITWGSSRTIINSNFTRVYDSLLNHHTRIAYLEENGTGGGAVYPAGSGIPIIVSGTSWGTTITDNSTNWNTAYSWGNHALGGYAQSSVLAGYVPTSRTINSKALTSNITLTTGDIGAQPLATILSSFSALPNSSGVLTNNGSGSLSWTAAGGGGTVTSVGFTTPTGLTISGSPITTSGTLTLGFTAGYSIPTTANQTNWSTAYTWVNTNGANAVTAYGWGNHALAGYLTSQTSHADVLVDGDFASQGIMLRGASPGTYSILTNNSTAWNAAQPGATILTTLSSLANGSGVLTNNGSGVLSWGSAGSAGTVTSVGLSAPLGLTVTNSPITTTGVIGLSFTAGYSIPTTADQANWGTAYSERLRWDGGSTGLTASTGRTSLGATTLGSNLFTVPNVAEISFVRINANNTVTTQNLADFKTTLGLATDIQTSVDNAIAAVLAAAQPGVAVADTAFMLDTYMNKNDIETKITMGLGSGILADTVVFNNGAKIGALRWAGDTLRVTSVYNFMDAGIGTASLSLQVYWGTSKGTPLDSLFTNPITITSLTGANTTTFKNSVIPPDRIIWGVIRGLAILNKPSFLSTSIIGFIQ